MGCNHSSTSVDSKKQANTPASMVPLNRQTYANVKSRNQPPGENSQDGYDLGLRVRENVGGLYSICIGTYRKTGEKVSIKEYNLTGGVTDLEERIVTEVAILARLSGHPGFPVLKELFVIEKKTLFIVTDYVDTFRLQTFVDVRAKQTMLSSGEARKIFKALLSILIHAHEHMIILRNINLDTVMVVKKQRRPSKDQTNNAIVSDFDVKIADVSQSVDFGCPESIMDHPLFNWTHQLPFLSPEIALKLPYTQATDIWSLGVLLYCMISGESPFPVLDYMDRMELTERIKNGNFATTSPVWGSVNKDIISLISGMLATDPLSRLTCSEIRRNDWVLNG